MEQRVCINFCVKNGIKCSKTLEMLTVAYGESTLSKKNVYKWYKLFQEGLENVNDEPRSGRPSTSKTDENVQEVKEIVLKNRRITIREIADDLNISFGSCQSILTDVLGMTRVSAKFVPKLNFDQKQRRMNIGQDMLNDVNDDPDLLKRVITGDETWVYGYDVEGRRFATIEEIKAASLEELKAIPKSAFQKCFDDWKKRWHKCIVSEGDYFEGDNIILDE
ncbi:protein GVQW3-like [Nylanderia fulva]|uniref:protein GVQW3-like n=1 Tax=Nylanderia fulva TaxID=613905 RepID=UPI0010FB123D|nr:protein GVQW3-like [Nylanderia fulva]